MHLNEIKLVGFKSFVGPLTLTLPGNLVGVVGPNGSGKSNVIDAVRWVLGENSVKELRGSSSLDVIFSGSKFRQSSNQASVELIFDNSAGRIGGEYAAYSTISVKRLVDRDSQSTYFLNGRRCRKRDVTDLFLGTGLGSASYAIVEQGMISRMIEAKPEDIREYIEEAAGISRYKEKRHETELHMNRTRENLTRINDLRHELEAQLARLERQAKNARYYISLKEREREEKSKLLMVRWLKLHHTLEQLSATLQVEQSECEKQRALLNSLEANLETENQKVNVAQQDAHQVENQVHELQERIVGQEQALHHARAHLKQREQDIHQLEQELSQFQRSVELDKVEIEKCLVDQKKLQNDYSTQESELLSSSRTVEEAERQVKAFQSRFDEFQQQAVNHAQEFQVGQTALQGFQRQKQEIDGSLARLIQERSHLKSHSETTELADLTQAIAKIQELLKQEELEHLRINEAIQTKQKKELSQQQKNQFSLEEVRKLKDRIAILKNLQQSRFDREVDPLWMERYQLQGIDRLSQLINVEEGWEIALETVLSSDLNAFCIPGLPSITSAISEMKEGSVSFVEQESSLEEVPQIHGISLRSKVQSPRVLPVWLNHIYILSSLSEGLAKRHELASYESFITQEGLWIGKNWIRYSKKKDVKDHAIILDKELKNLLPKLTKAEKVLLEGEAEISAIQREKQELEQSSRESQKSLLNHRMKLNEVENQKRFLEATLERLQKDMHRIEQEVEDKKQRLLQVDRDIQREQKRLEEAQKIIQEDEIQKNRLNQERATLQDQWIKIQNGRREQQNSLARIQLEIRATETRWQSLQKMIERGEQQQGSLEERKKRLFQETHEQQMSMKQLEEALKIQYDDRIQLQQKLNQAKQMVLAQVQKRESLVESRKQSSVVYQQSQQSFEDHHLKLQETKAREEVLKEQLSELSVNQELLAAQITEADTEMQYVQELEKIATRIARLGAINLAAVSEHEDLQKRKTELDVQSQDLVDALETLKNAMNRIDSETHKRFRETFDRLQQHFQRLFPKVFQGGEAYLELTGEDITTAGVSLMVRPLGKRVRHIGLLSGGEKALTAIAFVFSLFQLNPAPFCLLDEVDAPLDDTNTSRFRALLKEMAAQVQLIFVSHNKGTIEMAEQLIGVTMHEPGVSAIVTVDLERALEMSEQ